MTASGQSSHGAAAGLRDAAIAAAALVALTAWGLMLLAGAGRATAFTVEPAWLPGPLAGLPLAGREISFGELPLLVMLLLGGTPLVSDLLAKLVTGSFGSDLLAGVSIVTAVLLGEFLAGTLVVLMLSGGAALEARAVARAGDVLGALARRMPTTAHRRREGSVDEIPLAEIVIGDVLVVPPHAICPVDGTVLAGRGSMDESYLTGEPYQMSKAPGSTVLSGAINGEAALEIRTERVAADSRYAKIMQVLETSWQQRPQMRRLADTLGALYTPLAVAIAAGAWAASGSPTRFLAVLVVATPCPLLIAIPVAIIGAVSLAAKRGIVIRDPALLERLDTCRTAIFDKTGTLTYGAPQLIEAVTLAGWNRERVLALAAGLERYSKHPLAAAVVAAADAEGLPRPEVEQLAELPGRGLTGSVAAAGEPRMVHEVAIISRGRLAEQDPAAAGSLPPAASGLECVVLIDGGPAAVFRFRDSPRADGASFVGHLEPAHGLEKVMLVSGDREEEVRWLAEIVGIREVYGGVSPEGKLEIVRRETAAAPTVFVGDGINDAPALAAATVGIAMGAASDVTGEAAGAVVMEQSLARVDELFHIGRRLRRVALESAVGGMAASGVGMAFAAAGLLPPAAGALVQEVIDIVAVSNALRTARAPQQLSDY